MRPPSPTTLDPLTRAERGAGSRPRAAPIRVVLAERDTCIRRDMRSLLHGSGHGLFEVVAETSDSAGAQRFAHAHQPCVVVLDLDLPGYASLMVSIAFFAGVQLLSLGVIGEYIARIFAEVKGRPLYLVAERIGAEPLTKG